MMVLARIGVPSSLLLGYALAVILVAATVVLVISLRRRGPVVVLPIAIVGALLAMASLVPEAEWEPRWEVRGELEGTARFHIVGDPTDTATGGGTVRSVPGSPPNATTLPVIVECPASCTFLLPAAHFGAALLQVELDAAHFRAEERYLLCEQTPLLLRLAGGCMTCSLVRYEAPAETRARVALEPMRSPVC